MIISYLRLFNFKNYSDCSFNFNPRLNFIYGDNGNGKTNILEAVSVLCYTKSFLQSSESDIVRYGEDKFEIGGIFESAGEAKSKVICSYDKINSKKQITLNNEAIGRQKSFFGKIPLVVLSPGDIKLTAGTPSDRRRSFDILISQVSKVYFDDLRSYNRILRQKNSLLKDNLIQKKYSSDKLKDMVSLWNRELIEYGVKIIGKRLDVISEFQNYLEDNFTKIVGDSYKPMLSYRSDLFDDENYGTVDMSELKKHFEASFEEKFPVELNRGMSLTGPHRDDYVFKTRKNGDVFELRNFASQGEHKTFLVALRLSEYFYLRDKLEGGNTGEPVLLLDDVFSELDKKRTEKISQMLSGFGQVFITTTDSSYLDILKKIFPGEDISVFCIVNGTIQKSD